MNALQRRSRGPSDWSHAIFKVYVTGTPSAPQQSGWLAPGTQTILQPPSAPSVLVPAFSQRVAASLGRSVRGASVRMGAPFAAQIGGMAQPVQVEIELLGYDPIAAGSDAERAVIGAMADAFGQTFLPASAAQQVRAALLGGANAGPYRINEPPAVHFLAEPHQSWSKIAVGLGIGAALAALIYYRRR